MKYKRISPWANTALWEYKRNNKIKELYISLIQRFPRVVMISVSGILQAYGRPLKMKLR